MDSSQVWGVDRMIANKGKVTFSIPNCIEAGQYLLRVEMIGRLLRVPRARIVIHGLPQLSTVPRATPALSSTYEPPRISARFNADSVNPTLQMECAQLQVTGGGSTKPATVSFPGAYSGELSDFCAAKRTTHDAVHNP